jgi:hypothetical protein
MYLCELLLMSFSFAGTYLKMDKRLSTLSVYLMSEGVPYGSFVAVKFFLPLSEDDFNDAQFEELPTKPADVVCAATTFDLRLSTDDELSLISALRRVNCFKTNSILFNNVLHTVGGKPEPVKYQRREVTASFSDELIYWVRLQIHMKIYLEELTTQGETTHALIPPEFFNRLRANDCCIPELLALACTLQSPALCWHLSPHVKGELIWNSKVSEVVRFFKQSIHGYTFLTSEATLKRKAELDDSLSDGLVTYLKSAIDIVASQIHLCNLRQFNQFLFKKPAQIFEYLALIYKGQRYVLKRRDFTWQSACNKVRITWHNNWSVYLNDELIAYKTVGREVCIPSLSCMQGEGVWFVEGVGDRVKIEVEWCSVDDDNTAMFGVKIATKDMYDATKDEAHSDVTLSKLSPHSPVACNPSVRHALSNDISELSSENIKMTKIHVPSNAFGSLLSFLGWDPVLNVLDNPESFETADLHLLLQRCLWLWADRNGEHEQCQKFHQSAVSSLQIYPGRAATIEKSVWQSFYRNYGCIETPRLWTSKERMMLMIACSWPNYFWDNIDQMNSDESSFQVRGMAFLHPRVADFLRHRMIEFGFINDDDFPPQFSEFSAVNICSNVCRNGLTNWNWRNEFVLDFSASPMFLKLEGCSKTWNANGTYAATTSFCGRMRVYAFAAPDMRSRLSCIDSRVQLTNLRLAQPTVILVTFTDSKAPVLHFVKFAFALNLQECLIKCGEDGQYFEFFSVSHEAEEFIYQPITAPVLTALAVTSRSAPSHAIVKFDFGASVEAAVVPLEELLKKRQFRPLTDQGGHTDGTTQPKPWYVCKEIEIGKKKFQVFGVSAAAAKAASKKSKQSADASVAPAKQLGTPPFSSLDICKVSKSCLYGVFPNTMIGVIIARRLVYINISDGCGFLFSFWFEHFGIGTDQWHWRPHSYFHSTDIRQFPVSTAEQLFVIFAAVKLLRNCKDPLSHGAFERLILECLDTFKNPPNAALPKVFESLEHVTVQTEISNVFNMVFGAQNVTTSNENARVACAFSHCNAAADVFSPAAAPSSHGTADAVFSAASTPSATAPPKRMLNPKPSFDNAPGSADVAADAPASAAPGFADEAADAPFSALVAASSAPVLVDEGPEACDFCIGTADVVVDNHESGPTLDIETFATTPSKPSVDDASGSADDAAAPLSHLPFFGLPNVKNSCWINAVLQCLLHTTELSRFFLKPQPDMLSLPESKTLYPCLFKQFVDYPSYKGPTPDRKHIRSLVKQLKKQLGLSLLKRDRILNISDPKPEQLASSSHSECSSSSDSEDVLVDPQPMVKTKKKKKGLTNQFMDSSECLSILLEQMCPHLFLLVQFGFRVTCSLCNNSRSKVEDPEIWTLPFCRGFKGKAASLYNCLSAYFVKELMTGDNKVTCDTCWDKREGTDHVRQNFLNHIPDLFCFILKRFEIINNTTELIDRVFDVPDQYDFGSHYCSPEHDTFRIYAVVCYVPGHYYAYIQPESDGPWTNCNDLTVVQVKKDVAMKDIKKRGYIFFWRRCTSSSSGLPKSSDDVMIIEEPVSQVVYVSDSSGDGQKDLKISVGSSDTGCPGCPMAITNQTYAAQTAVSQQGLALALSAGNGQGQVEEKEPVSPFTLPRHFVFSPGALQTRAVQLVKKQNEETGSSNFSSVLKQHNDRIYDVFNRQLEDIIPEAYTDDHDVAFLNSRSPRIDNEFISSVTVQWFFSALTTLFPDVMFLSPGLFHYNCKQKTTQMASLVHWKAKFNQRCPYAVLYPSNLPKRSNQPVTSLTGSNPGNHWVLFVFALTWKKHVLLRATSIILDPYNDSTTHANAQKFSKDIAKALELPNVQYIPHDKNFVKLQTGTANHHCGVFTMALALNFLTKTLPQIGSHLITDPKDTSLVGIELRKMVSWDCNHEPAMLNACLAMSPAFAGCDHLSQPPRASSWWRVTYIHDLVAALSLQPEFLAGGLFSMYGFAPREGLKKGFRYDTDHPERFQNGRVPTDGPFFFMNESFFVKVYCIGLIELKDRTDKASSKRATSAFIDASATSSACRKRKWWSLSFGLICIGLTTPCAYVCVGREKLSSISKETPCDVVGDLFHLIAHEDLMFHNDGYCGNVVEDKSGKKQAVDFERASMFTGKAPSALFFQYYARSVAMNDTASIQILMLQMNASGMEATHSYFRSIYQSGTFLETAFDYVAFETSTATAFCFVGFWHLMSLLHEEAKRHGDTTPELALLESKSCISCKIRPRCCVDGSVVSCKIFFEHTEDFSIQIRSAQFEHVNVAFPPFLQLGFERGQEYFRLRSEEEAEKFFDFALSMAELYSSPGSSSPSSSEEQNSTLGKRKPTEQNLRLVPKTSRNNSERCVSLDKQFNFLSYIPVSADVWRSCASSVQQRFPDYQCRVFAPRSSFMPPKSVLDISHLDLKVFVVAMSNHTEQCLEFIDGQNILSIDTETAYPRFPENGAPISLLQIGTNHQVFLIQVATVSDSFFTSLKMALKGKLLVHWGGSDKDDVCRLLGRDLSAQWFDLQGKVSPEKGPKVGLDTCIYQYLNGIYSLSKEWTLSGWDLYNLHARQIAYAALDVASCHIFYLHHELGLAMFQCDGTRFHSFFTPKTINKGSSLDRHGFSFEAEFCCHFHHGHVIQGLYKKQLSDGAVSVTPKGFKATLWEEDEPDSGMVSQFVHMLNSKKFCCHCCSDSNWFGAIEFSCPSFKVVGSDLLSFSFARGVDSLPTTLRVPFPADCSAPCYRKAFFCLSMLGIFLKCKFKFDINVVNSVLCDCRCGFISSTLSYFQQ